MNFDQLNQAVKLSREQERAAFEQVIDESNQVMHFLSNRYQSDDPRMRTTNTVEIRLRRGADGSAELVVNGWPALARGVTTRPVR